MENLQEIFHNYKNERIFIYGTGWAGQNIAAALKDSYHIIGFTNSYGEHRELLGLPVFPLDEAVHQNVKLMIVGAQLVTCRLIADKIGDICREHHIDLLDARGTDLLAREAVRYDFSHVEGITRSELLNQISAAEVVSFDLFDTLVARQILYPADVYELVDSRLREQGVVIDGFPLRRKEAERRLSREPFPTLTKIYEELLSDVTAAKISADRLAELEWQTDYQLIVPRQDVCEVFRAAVAKGKRVYIVTDTWYGAAQVAEILRKCGISQYSGIIDSCEYGVGKTGGLFRHLLEKETGRKVLHIGDNYTADVECARSEGIDACHIRRGLELLQSIGGMGFPRPVSLSDRIKLGMFVAKLFNSPFQFEDENRQVQVADVYDFGYLFWGPVLSSFVLWFYRQIREQGIHNIWFCARDGYLVQQMYRELEPDDSGTYFLTSRVAALRTGLRTEEDIRFVERTAFHGALEEHLRERYGVDMDSAEAEQIDITESGVMRYQRAILAASRVFRENYLKYLNSIDLRPGDLAMFDGIGRGTTQLYLDRLAEPHMRGFYLLQIEDKGQQEYGTLEVRSFYSAEERYGSALYDTYYLLEFLMTAPHACVLGFDEQGAPTYKAESRSEDEIRCCMRGQEGISDYFRAYLALCPRDARSEDKQMDEALLALIRKVAVTDETFLNMARDDSFGNRKETVRELLGMA